MPEVSDERVLVLMPTAKDGERTARALAADGLSCTVCNNMRELCEQIALGAGVALLTEEAYEFDRDRCLQNTLAKQPPWSDFPLVLLAREGVELRRSAVRETLNVTLVERPLKMRSLLSVVKAGLRARRHQYGVREHLAERLKAAESLRQSEGRYRALVEATSQAVWSWSPSSANGDFEQTQRWWEQITGQSTEDQKNNPLIWLDVVHPEDRPAAASHWSKALESDQPYDVEYRVRTRSGGWCFIHARGIPVLGPDGSVREWVGTLNDISERRNTEIENNRLLLEIETERLRLADVFQNAPSFMAVLRGKDHVFERANDHYYELVGRRGIIGRPVRQAVPEAQGQGFFEILDQVYASGEPFVKQGARIMLMRGGHLEERFVDFVFQPLRDLGGTVSGIIVQGVDLTERKRAEEALRISEADFRSTFEGAGVGKAQADSATGGLVRVNPKLCELTGYTADELLSMTIRDLTHPDDRTAGDEWFRALVNGEVDQYAVENRYLRKTKEVLWVRVTATIVRSSEGLPMRVSAIIEDVTARIHAEEALKAADRKKDDFIAMLAHELRNPLAPIRNGLQVIRLSDDPETRDQAHRMMDRQLAHMVRLIDDLLDVSRITRNKMELRRSSVLLADIISSAVETARPTIEEAEHELSISLPEEPITLDADLTRLSQVFGNLLTNSAKYTERGGRLSLTANVQGNEVAIVVEDNGTGIPADALPNIFNMFSQVDRSIERRAGGLGIGLALVKGLVEMHGGRVTAYSRGEGHGSTFAVYLPIQSGERMALPETTNTGQLSRGLNRRVLVVDDNRDGAATLSMMLELTGNTVARAHDGLEAVSVAETFRPEIILMDVGMPRLNGLDATKRIRAQAWGAGMTIIALTGWGQEHDRERSREAGCNGHLVKPVDMSDLERLLAKK